MDSPQSERAAIGPMPAEPCWIEALATLEGEGHRSVLDDAADLAIAEASSMRLVDRLRASGRVTVELPGLCASGDVTSVGSEAVELTAVDGLWLVPLAHVCGIGGLRTALAVEPASAVDGDGVAGAQATLPRTFAAMARGWIGRQVDVMRRDGRPLAGVLRSTGADHLEVMGERSLIAVPMRAVIALRRRVP